MIDDTFINPKGTGLSAKGGEGASPRAPKKVGSAEMENTVASSPLADQYDFKRADDLNLAIGNIQAIMDTTPHKERREVLQTAIDLISLHLPKP